MEELLPTMVRKTMDHHVLLNLASTTMVSISFFLWMSHGGVDTFALIINFLNDTYMPMHITMDLFEVNEIVLKIIHGCITISFVGKFWYVAPSS